MSRKIMSLALIVSLAVVLLGDAVFARGFGGGGRGGGFGGGSGGYGDGSRGGSGGMSSFGRTPTFSSPGSFDRGGGENYGRRGASEGMYGGQISYGSRSGSHDTARGGSINYGAAGSGGRGPGGAAAGRGAYGISGTTAGGRDYSTVGRVGGAVGPGGNAVGVRSNLGAVSGPRGTAVSGSRGGIAVGSGGAFGGREYGAGAYRPNGYNPYGAYHRGWVHGYWNGHGDSAWGWRNSYWGAGMGLGWGLSSWGFGSSLYGMGYSSYLNPYDTGAANLVGQTSMAAPYNYSQPIDTANEPAAQSVTDPAMALFDAGRASFQQGNYADALQQANEALAKLPDDTTLHEFRALCLFALGRYDESAATLYAVLSVGPGWDWTTLIGLYPGVDVYTAQLRALEDFCQANSGSATARFVLAYHYLTQGHTDAAVDILKQVVALKPGDTLSAKLLRQLDPPKDQPATATVPADTTPPQGASIAGSWTARPSAGTEITLTVQPGGGFVWQVTQQGKAQQFSGSSTYGDGMFTLAQEKGPALVGRVRWVDADNMTFRIVGDGPDDPGLSFSK